MDSKRKKDLINSLINDDNSFTDVMSRKEKKKRAKQKKFEEQLIKELEKNKKKRMEKELREKQQEKYKMPDKKLESTTSRPKQLNSNERDFQLHEPTKKKGWGKFSKFYLFLIILLVVSFLTYSIYTSFHQIDQIYIIINSTLISIFAIFFLLTSLITKESAKKKMTIFTTFILIGFIGFHIAVETNFLKLPQQAYIKDFSNQTISKVITWASNHNVKLNYEYDYSDSIKSNKVISQNVEPNTLVKDIKSLNVVVSNGPNYDLTVNIPDMIHWEIDKVLDIIEENKLNNVIIDFEFSEETRDTVIEQSRTGEIKRSDELKIKFSLGREEDLKPVAMKDLINMKEFDATLWLKRNGIKYEIKYEFSDDFEKGRVISTTPKEGTMINQKEMSVTIIISKGKKIKAPDFTQMSIEEINVWAEKNNITIHYGSEYNASIKVGNVIRASVEKGATLEEGQIVYIITSKGILKMISFGENDLEKIKSFANEHQLILNIIEQFSDLPAGQIIDISVKAGETLNEGQGIEIIVSKGKATSIPNFIGVNITKAKEMCSSANLNCSFNYAYSTKTKNTIIYQNKSYGSEVTSGTSIILTVSNGQRPASNNSGNNNSSSGNSGSNPTPTPVCTPYTFILGGAGSTGYQTYSMIKNTSNNKYLNITPNYVGACPNGNATNGAICSSSVTSGTQVTTCDTIVVTIVLLQSSINN